MRRATVLLGLSPAWLFAIACADSTEGKSGETHFLCKTARDCATKFGPAYVCSEANRCVLPGDAGSAGGNGGDGGNGGAASGGDGSGGSGNVSTVDSGSSNADSGSSNVDSGNRGTGGSRNIGSGGSPAGSGGGGSFVCAHPNNSDCSVEKTCEQVDCGGVSLDEHACLRAECVEDRDCLADERCTLAPCDDTARCYDGRFGICTCDKACVPQAHSCDCTIAHRCNPVDKVGPRGDFVSLDVVYASGPCPTPMGCSATWHVTPDGKVASRNQTTPVNLVLSADDQATVTNWVDGPDLRPALSAGLPCMNDQITDVDLELTLTLSTGTFSKHANGCFGKDNVLNEIYYVLSHL